MFIYLYIYLYVQIKCEMAVRILLKIGRCDILISESNLALSHPSKPHCSSVVTERSPKKALPHLLFYLIKGNAQPFTCYHIKEALMHFNMAPKLTRKKPISNLMGKKPISNLMGKKPIAARNFCFSRAAEGTEICPHTNHSSFLLPNLLSPLFLYTKNKILAQPK